MYECVVLITFYNLVKLISLIISLFAIQYGRVQNNYIYVAHSSNIITRIQIDRHSLTRSMGVTAMIKFVSYLSQADISVRVVWFPTLVKLTTKTI
jgi:hypothetical protein